MKNVTLNSSFPLSTIVRTGYIVKKGIQEYTVKKISDFPVPSWDVTTPWPGIIELFPARDSLVSDIPAGDGKIANLFYSVGSAHSRTRTYKFFLSQ